MVLAKKLSKTVEIFMAEAVDQVWRYRVECWATWIRNSVGGCMFAISMEQVITGKSFEAWWIYVCCTQSHPHGFDWPTLTLGLSAPPSDELFITRRAVSTGAELTLYCMVCLSPVRDLDLSDYSRAMGQACSTIRRC